MDTPLDVLLVEDSWQDAELVVRELYRAGFSPNWKQVQTEAGFIEELEKVPDIILSDYSLPEFTGLRALELLRGSGKNIPFILVSGTVGEEVAVEAMKEGVTDYLLKDRLIRLGPAIHRALRQSEERAENLRLAAQLIEVQKMEVIGRLASGIAHDFNNILAIIMANCDLIASDLPTGHPLQDHAAEIHHASERAANLTRQLLVFSRKETIERVVLDPNAIVLGLEEMLRRLINEDIVMTILPGKECGRILADSGYVGQVLMNLVVNARDAMPNGGEIRILTDSVKWEGNPLERIPSAEYVRLRVTDTGTGMTDEVKKHLFEAFFTTKPSGQGTGLGLATCRTIVHQCGGHIRVSSEVGRGTTFEIYFPKVDSPGASPEPAMARPPVPKGNETLLVVEDEPSLRHLAQKILESQGYQVLVACNGEEALQIVQDHRGTPIALILTDVIMPIMGGKIMAERIKASHREIKILFTSGYTEDAIQHHGVRTAELDFLPKPYAPAFLARKVREMLDRDQGP